MSARLRSQDHARDTLVTCRQRRRMPATAVGTGNAPIASPSGAEIERKSTVVIGQCDHSNAHRLACCVPFASPLRPLSP